MAVPDIRPLPELQSLPASDRISLRHATERDVALVLDASTDPLIPLITSVPQNCSPDLAKQYLARQLRRPAERSGWSLMIADRATDTAVGNLFIGGDAVDLGGAEIGYWIGPSHRGKGYAGEALSLIRDWAQGEVGVDRLQLYIDPDNLASLRTAERAGFAHRTTHDQWERVGDAFRPMTTWTFGDGPIEPGELARLEHRMWLDDYRGDARWFDHHLHRDFVEHGCSGKLWSRDEIIRTPITGIDVELPFTDRIVHEIDSHTWLLTYLAVQPTRTCRRMSIWQRTPEGWRMRFHQGTPVPSI